MKKICWILFLVPNILFSQSDSSVQRSGEYYENYHKLEYRPVSTLGLEILNIYDSYPSFLLSFEYQWNDNFAFLQEGGPVVVPESYSGEEFIRYFGFKSRSEIKFYYDVNPIKNARNWIGLDVFYQHDTYRDDINIDYGSYIEFSRGDFSRNVLGTHIRVGTQRIFNKGNVLLSASLGIGRSLYYLDKPEVEGRVNSNVGIREESPLDPFSVNVRLKLGFVLKKIKNNKQDYQNP